MKTAADIACAAVLALLALFELPSGALAELVTMAFEFLDAQEAV